MQLSQAEDAFPHQKKRSEPAPGVPPETQRVEAHILVCFLTLALWRTLEQWMRGKGLGTCAPQLVKEVATVRSLNVVLPVKQPQSEQPRQVRLYYESKRGLDGAC
jgi:hypothetical protein